MSAEHLCLYRASTSHLDRNHPSRSRCEITFENGDVTHPGGDPADLLIISAFPNDYTPVPGTVIGALYERGLSVEDLDKNWVDRGLSAEDLPKEWVGSSCWISPQLPPQAARAASAAQVFCCEGPWKAGKEKVLNNLRTLFSALLSRAPRSPAQAWSIHMPLIGAGNAEGDPEMTLRWIVTAFQEAFASGLNVRSVRIIEWNKNTYEGLCGTFRSLRDSYSPFTADVSLNLKYKLFISYSHTNMELVQAAYETIKPRIGRDVFFDIDGHVQEGMILSHGLAAAVRQSRAIAAVVSRDYVESPYCNLEFQTAFNLAHLREDSFSLKTVFLEDPKFLPNPSDYRDVKGPTCQTSGELAAWILKYLQDLDRTPPAAED